MSNDMDFLLPEPARPADSYRWATVVSVVPIRIRLDGDPESLESSPVTLCPLVVGRRVWIQIHGRMVVILGIAQDGQEQVI